MARLACVLLLGVSGNSGIGAAGLIPSDGGPSDLFGDKDAVSTSGNLAVVGAPQNDARGGNNPGAAYVFRNLDTATGTITQSTRLVPNNSSGVFPSHHRFGQSVALSGNLAIGAAPGADSGGLVYVFRGVDGSGAVLAETATLRPAASSYNGENFGASVSLSGTVALVSSGGNGPTSPEPGKVYLFRNLHTIFGTVTENAILRSSDNYPGNAWGFFIHHSGNIGIVSGQTNEPGSAYLFRNLDNAQGNVTEHAKLIPSDGTPGDLFGWSVSVSATLGLGGAPYAENNRGSAYVFRGLDTVLGTVPESLKLVPSSGSGQSFFGWAVSLSGKTALVGAVGDVSYRGSVYLFRDVSTATGTTAESVILRASEGVEGDAFGYAVSADGDQFVVSAIGRAGPTGVPQVGKAYSGSLSAFTILDSGNTSKNTFGLSFVSREDWVIGQTTDGNEVTVLSGDAADVTGAGKAVYIGQTAGSDGNALVIKGSLSASLVQIGSPAGSRLNALQLESTATRNIGVIRIASGNKLVLDGNYTAPFALFNYLGSTQLQVSVNGAWIAVTPENHEPLINRGLVNGRTVIGADIYALSAVSRKMHGDGGVWDVNLPVSGVPLGIESRRGGGTSQNTHQMIVTFSQPVTLTASPNVTGGLGGVGPSVDEGNQVMMDLVNVANAQRLEVTVPVTDGVTSNNVAINIGVLVGDANGNGTVNASDLGAVKAQSGQPVNFSNFRLDVNTNGAINASDASFVKAFSGTSILAAAAKPEAPDAWR